MVSLVKAPQDLNVSIEEINSEFTDSAYFYPVTNTVGDLKIDVSKENTLSQMDKQGDLVNAMVRMGYYPIDLSIRNVVMSSAADKAGMKKGDILTHLNGKSLSSFEELRAGLQLEPDGKGVEIGLISAGKPVTKTIVPEVKVVDKKKTKLMGIESSVEYVQPKLIVAKADGIGDAITTAFTRTWDGVIKTFSGYKKLITREVSLDNIGGPLAIGKVASDSLNISLSMFFRLMAIISINLAVINLFPIPVLDGGHIMFLIFEAINGGPLSRRKLEIAQRLGVSVLFFLIFIAIFNDISRLF